MNTVVTLACGTTQDSNTECPVCLFDSVMRIPIYALMYTGVAPLATVRVCGRCNDESRDQL